MPKKALRATNEEYEAAGLELASSIQRTLKALVISTIILFVGLGGLAYYAYRIAKDNNKALCAIRADATKRAIDGANFLKDHPKGIPGIDAATLHRSIQNSQQTAETLAFLSCPPQDIFKPKSTTTGFIHP